MKVYMNTKSLLPMTIIYLLFMIGCRESSDVTNTQEETSTYPTRMAAEWEPAIGVLIAWPLGIPHKLVIELAHDTRLVTMVPDENAREEAEHWYAKWGIDLENVQFVVAPQGEDSYWLRDWGPHAVFDQGTMKLADGQYPNSTPFSGPACDAELGFIFTKKDEETGADIVIPTTEEDLAPRHIGEALSFEVVELPFVFTGGNVLTDGRGTTFSTCIIVNENEYMGLGKNEFLEKANTLLGIENYHILSNFEAEGIQHIDCFMKILNEERLFVTRPPKNHELFPVYEDIVQKELSTLKNCFGRPYEILRLDTDVYEGDLLAAYSNSLILNQTVYVPLFSIPQDSIALRQWRDAMPGYTVKGFEYILDKEPLLTERVRNLYSGKIGWTFGDALHCRTRAVWDPDMLYISVDRVPQMSDNQDSSIVYAQIIDYSSKGLFEKDLKLFWKPQGSDSWTASHLRKTKDAHMYSAAIPTLEPGQAVAYYVAASSYSGRQEFMPRVGPSSPYFFTPKE